VISHLSIRAAQDRDMASAGVPYYDQPETRELYRSWRKILDSYPADVFPGQRGGIAEIWFQNPQTARLYLTKDGLPLFNFRLMLAP
jgi:alpha-glucosidase